MKRSRIYSTLPWKLPAFNTSWYFTTSSLRISRTSLFLKWSFALPINDEIEDRTFDPTKYIKSDLEQFFVSTLVDRFLSHKRDSLAPSYVKDFERMIGKAKDHFRNKDVREIRKLDVVKYHDVLKAADTRGRR